MAVKQKLRSQRGATLMAALLFFLVAAVCGSIILAAATATLSRITTQAEDARAYYSLTSAARLVRDDLLNSRWKVVVKQASSDGVAITRTYMISALDKDGDTNEKISKTFVPWMLNNATTAILEEDSSVFSTSNTMNVVSTNMGDALPTIYAVPTQINFKTLYEKYDQGKNTELKILMTNDPEGIDTNGNCSFRSSYKDSNGKTRQVYWLELTLNAVKIPAGYVDKTDENHVGDIEFQIGWDNASIRKLEN